MPKRLTLPILLVVVFAACQTAPPAPPPPEPVASPAAAPPTLIEEKPIGTVRVTASTLNVRAAPSSGEAVIATAKKGERLSLLKTEGSWSRVRMASGAIGWVSSKLVKSEKHCLADRDFDILDGPPLAFSQEGAHGVVVVEVTVETNGKVSATKVTQNTTGEPAMAKTAEQEISVARFAPPVRNCTAKRFIYVYTRRF